MLLHIASVARMIACKFLTHTLILVASITAHRQVLSRHFHYFNLCAGIMHDFHIYYTNSTTASCFDVDVVRFGSHDSLISSIFVSVLLNGRIRQLPIKNTTFLNKS